MTNDELHRIFDYEPDTGLLRRVVGGKPYPWRGIGKNSKYLATTIGGETFYLHRLVFQWHHGHVPYKVDHRIDTLPLDNRIGNLRECTDAQNQYNSKRKTNNRSGFKGVAYCTGYRLPWRARIVVNKKPILLGRFVTAAEAAQAYAAGAVKHAGEFARRD